MATQDRLAELERETVRLTNEAERYRMAAEETVHQLDWCIDYFARNHLRQLAKSLSDNRARIRRDYLHAPD